VNNVHIKICNLSCDYLLFFRIIFRLWIVFLTLNTTTMETTVKRAGSRHDTNIFLIWEHQRYFQTAFQSMAKNMFDLIDHEVSPHVFLLGVKMNDVADKPLQVYLEPKDCGYSADIFSGLKKLVHELESMEKTTDKVSKSIGASDIQSNVNNYSYIRAIETILSNEGLQNDKQKFVSYPAFINDFAVFIILEVQEGALYEQYSLKREIYKSNPSFVKSCIWIYLRTCLGFLKNPSNTSDIRKRSCGRLESYLCILFHSVEIIDTALMDSMKHAISFHLFGMREEKDWANWLLQKKIIRILYSACNWNTLLT